MTGIVNVAPYNTVNLEIIQWPHAPVTMNVICMMGKITGSTLAERTRAIPARDDRPHPQLRCDRA